ncbi:MAG: phytanoyl-CoA dioxygenase family protein [Myxococcota bacterium]|nr:phytanoyl-CoA dioxygenase family protein [Myxococcota bacterium]
MPDLQRFDARRDLDWEKAWKAFDEDGGLIVESFIDPELLARLQADFGPLIQRHEPGSTTEGLWTEFHGDVTKRITGLPTHSQAWVELLCDERYQAMGDRYLGPNEYWLNTGQLICIGPGETPQMLHRDELNWPHAMRQHEITVTAIFALTDFTEANGATVIAPGSNHWPGALPKVPEEATCRATMTAGSALLYSGKVIHGGGANVTTDQWRVGLHAGFCCGWLRSEENFQLTIPLEVARTLPARARLLLGFSSYSPEFGGRLGLVDYDDAARLLD